MLHPPVISYSAVPKMLAAVFAPLFWPLIGLGAVLIVLVGLRLAWDVAQNKRLARSGIHEIDRMAGRTFERYLAVVFRQKGYKVELTRASKDQGADLVVVKEGVRTVVQAKRWKGRVGNKAVQEAVAAKGMYAAEQAMVVTNSFFTKSARELATANRVILWDRPQLVKELLHANAKQQGVPEVPPTAPSAESADPTVQDRCPRCQRPLVVRTSRQTKESFWGCTGYPKCHYTHPLEGTE